MHVSCSKKVSSSWSVAYIKVLEGTMDFICHTCQTMVLSVTLVKRWSCLLHLSNDDPVCYTCHMIFLSVTLVN